MNSSSVFFNRLAKYKFSEMLCSSTSEEQLKQNRVSYPIRIQHLKFIRLKRKVQLDIFNKILKF